jgi:hypothetical protein
LVFGQIFPGRKITESIMRTFFVVFSDPVFRQFSNFSQAAEDIDI